MDIKIKYLIIGIITMAIITALWRLTIFNNPNESTSIYESILFFLILIIPIFIGYKSKGNPIIFGFVLAITNLSIDQILLNNHITQLVTSTDVVEQNVAINMLSTGELHYLPTIENTIFLIILFVFLTFIGTLFNKKQTHQTIEN